MSQTFPTPTDWKSAVWWRNRSVEERLFHAKIPPRFKGDIELPDEICSWLVDYEPGSNLFIYGKSGAGKTAMAQSVLSQLIRGGASGRFTSSDRYIEMLKDQFDSENVLPEMYSSPYLVKYIKGVFDVVLVDGVGQERETEFSTHEIGSLIRRRYDDVNTVIVTTTLSPIDFVRRYGDRVKSAVMDMTQVKVS
jgi:DNA replication protein DnaC